MNMNFQSGIAPSLTAAQLILERNYPHDIRIYEFLCFWDNSCRWCHSFSFGLGVFLVAGVSPKALSISSEYLRFLFRGFYCLEICENIAKDGMIVP